MTGVIGCSQADISNEQTDKSPQGSRTAWPYIYCLELNKSLLGSPVYLILVFDLSTLVSILSLFELLKFIRLKRKRKKKHLLIYPPKTRQKIPGTTLLPGPCSGKNLISILVRDYIQKRRGQKTPRVGLWSSRSLKSITTKLLSEPALRNFFWTWKWLQNPIQSFKNKSTSVFFMQLKADHSSLQV